MCIRDCTTTTTTTTTTAATATATTAAIAAATTTIATITITATATSSIAVADCGRHGLLILCCWYECNTNVAVVIQCYTGKLDHRKVTTASFSSNGGL